MDKKKNYLFDFQYFIEELRENDKKKEIIEKYEKYVLNGEKIAGDIKDQKWYKDYLSKFDKLPAYKVPGDLENDFDYTLLFQLVAGSISTHYRLSYQSANEEGIAILPDLLITVQSGDQLIEKAISELWSFQIIRLFEIYIEEQINIELIIHDEDTSEEEKNSLCQDRRKSILKYKRRFTPPRSKSYKNKKVQTNQRKEIIAAHYCSLESAYWIIKTGKIFASDLSFMNDTSELTFGIDVLMIALNEIAKKKSLKPGFKKWLQQIINNDAQLRSSLDQATVYITSFCQEEDNLNQWRAYGDNGNGVCIVFDFNKTEGNLGRDLSDGFIMKNVKYLNLNGNHDSKAWKEVKKGIENEFNIIYKESKKASIEQILQYLTPPLRRSIRFYKNEKFREEEEFRQICLNIENDYLHDKNGNKVKLDYKLYEVETRVSRGCIVPYINLDISNIYGESAITKIIIGPSVHDYDKKKRSFIKFITDLNKKKSIDRINILCRNVSSQLPTNGSIMGYTKSLWAELQKEKLIIEPTREKVLKKAQEAFENFLNGVKANLDKKVYLKIEKYVNTELTNIKTHIYIKLEKSDEELNSPNEDRSIIQKSIIPYIP